MKKYFLQTLMLMCMLGMSISTAWGQQIKVYFAALKAQTSPASTGSGDVKLTWLDITGKPMEVPLAAALNGYALDNPAYYSGPSETAHMIGATMCAMDGIEVAQEIESQIYLTSYVYFHAEAAPANGSYLASWSFTDPAISRIDTAMGYLVYYGEYEEWDNELNDWKTGLNEEKSIPLKSPCFKVLPDTTNNAVYAEDGMEAYVMMEVGKDVALNKYNNLYAVFNKYLLGNPTATSGQLEAVAENTATLNISFEVEGDVTQFKDYYADFDFPATTFYEDANGIWTWDFAATPVEIISANKARAHAVVTYTAKSGITVGTHNATITVRMQGENPSTLNIPLSVNALDPNRPNAFLLNDKDTVERGYLKDLMGHVENYAKPRLILNKDTGDLALPNKTFTFDLNGNEAGAITIAGGGVTIAYSKFGGSAASLTVNDGKAILNGGTFGSLTIGTNGTLEQNGATVTGTATNSGTLTTTEGVFEEGLSSTGTLILNGGTFKGNPALTISGGTANINRGTINGTSVGLLISDGITTVKKLAAIKGGTSSVNRTNGNLTIECGKFDGPLTGVENFTSGYFKNIEDTIGLSENKELLQLTNGVEYNEGYRYFLGDTETAKANGVGVCRIGNVSYAKLEDAIAYANNNPSVENIVIFMTNNYTLPAGYYTLPANATIVVPMSDTQSKEVNMAAPRVVYNDAQKGTPYEQPMEFRRLTLASGVNIEVFGDIEMTCSQYASNEAYTSQPTGAYGHIVMEEGSHMTLQAGSEIRAWGFMTGKGEIDARRNSKVREIFQLGDWKGAFTSVKIVGMIDESQGILYNVVGNDGDKKIFPVTQYFIQNIESPVKYHPGAVLSTSASVSEGLGGMSVSMAATDIVIVGVNGINDAIFLMNNDADAENTWVRKWYDAENDIQVYDVNSTAHIGSMVLDMGELSFAYGNYAFTVPIRLNSAKFDLPLTCNFKIHLLSGTMDFLQNTCLLPGAEVEVDKESVVSVAMDEEEKEAYDAWVDGGKIGKAPVCYTGALYVYDADDWNQYAFGTDDNGDAYAANTKIVRYAPSWDGNIVAGKPSNGRPNVRDELAEPNDAKINVHGTFNTATGFVYTSVGNGAGGEYNPEGQGTGGANIFSSNEDAGTFIFNESASDAENPRKVYQVKTEGKNILGRNTTYDSIPFYPARLKHGNGKYENTDVAESKDAYCYQEDMWTIWKVASDPCFMKDNHGRFYAKPAEYVSVVVTDSIEHGDNQRYIGNSDHTFSDAAGTGRLFIVMDDCQWWEVENVDNLYHCIHPDNDTYYYWGYDAIAEDSTWFEKRFTITWLNWNGDTIKTIDEHEELSSSYTVTYGTMAEFLGTNPTREANIDSTYNFTGWKPALGPVTQDVTYTATYESQPRMYTITFLNEGGTLIETQFLTHNEVPVCENTPTKVGHSLVWTPAISPVIGDQTYTATWLEEPPTEWDVTFVNNANGVLQATEAISVSVHPTYNGSTPVKENADHSEYSSNEYTYTFWGWSAVIDGVAQQFAAGTELPCPTAPTTYTAVYTEAQKTYVIRFLDENGTLISGEEYNLPYGAMPVCSNTPIKENTAEWTYGFAWTPQIQTVMASEDPIEYRATFPATKNKYTVTLTSNLSGVCTFTGAGTFDYGTSITNVAVSYNDTKYTFDGWSDSEADAAHPSFELTGDITLTANFTPIALADHTVGKNDTWTVDEDTEVKDLIITSDGSACGQLLNPENLTIRGEAIYRITQSFAAGTWYAVAVPWRVNPATGIYGASGRLASGSQIYIIEFDGAAYASVGGTDDTYQYWHFLHETGADMVPGKLYMIYLTGGQSKLDFYKKAGAALQTRNLTVSTASGSAGASFANWNAISNPALYTADLSTGVTQYQTYDNNDGQTYTVQDATTNDLIVAKPIFVQVSTPGTVYATVHGSASPAPAYRRTPADDEASKFVVEISRNGKMADRLIVETADEKEDRYVIGQDLAKFGVSTKVAQMWIDRYNAKLCVNTIEPKEERAEYPLSLFSPATGEYVISAALQQGDNVLYLTRNGEAIANLTDGIYTLTLDRGTTYEYGLRISARSPQVTTGCDEVIVDSKDATATKVLINNQVLIIRGGEVYTITGAKVK